VNCDACTPQQIAQLNAFGAQLQANVSEVAKASDGWFLTACHQHEHTCQWRDWTGITIGGVSMQQVRVRASTRTLAGALLAVRGSSRIRARCPPSPVPSVAVVLGLVPEWRRRPERPQG
jgi:hypothetical protein